LYVGVGVVDGCMMTSLQYLGIPLVAGVITRFTVMHLMSKRFLQDVFLPRFSPLALLGLLYTIIVMFAYQGHHIVQNLGPVFRVFVPMILYFVIMWTSAFGFIYHLTRKEARHRKTTDATFGYEVAVVQAFTAGSNNFVSALVLHHDDLSFRPRMHLIVC
jgi:ACR3 family arsenite transporter